MIQPRHISSTHIIIATIHPTPRNRSQSYKITPKTIAYSLANCWNTEPRLYRERAELSPNRQSRDSRPASLSSSLSRRLHVLLLFLLLDHMGASESGLEVSKLLGFTLNGGFTSHPKDQGWWFKIRQPKQRVSVKVIPGKRQTEHR